MQRSSAAKKHNESTELQLGEHWLCRWWVGKSCLGADTDRGATGRVWAGFRCLPPKWVLKSPLRGGLLWDPMRSPISLHSCPLLVAFCLKVTDGAFVPCPGDQTLLWEVGEEEKDRPGQSWEWHLDLSPPKEWKAGKAVTAPFPISDTSL